MEEVNQVRITLGLHTILAIVMGYVSFTLANNWLSLFVGFIVLIALGFILEKFLGKKGIKFWIANGVIIYLFLWLVSWAFFFNL